VSSDNLPKKTVHYREQRRGFQCALPPAWFPPKLLWLRIGNCSAVAIERLLRDNHEAILLFNADLEAGMMALE